MSYKISFIGDVMLGRVIGTKYSKEKYNVVSDELTSRVKDSDFVIANLESPVVESAETEGDHLQFKGNPEVLDSLKWINGFSLSNNHINDAGVAGMDETVSILDRKGFQHNGLFEGEYKPLVLDGDGQKIAIVTVTDMMNIPFADGSHWDVLRVGEERVFDILSKLHNDGYCVILYAHIGILFCRYPNPVSFEYLHKCADAGADIIVTAHSHCLGCMEEYKGKPIFHSLGDFVMDGSSYRRRRSAILNLSISGRTVDSWEIIPAEINFDYETIAPSENVRKSMMSSFDDVSKKVKKNADNYQQFFKNQYKKELAMHIYSTLTFLWKQRGITGMLKMVWRRMEDVKMVFGWMSKDRSKDQRDDEAIKADRKKFSDKDLFDVVK